MKNSHLILLGFGALAGLQPQALAQAVVDLGSAGGFAILAGSGISFDGESNTVTGDIGSHPTASITIADGASFVLNGTNHGDNAITAAAKGDLVTAFENAAGQGPGTTRSGLGNETLAPGIFTSASTFSITGTLTLDGGGDSNSVWLFQAGSSLTTDPNSQVLLINGAQSGNVYWQLGESATLGDSSSFVGNILALTSISLDPNAAVLGRLLARNGAVTLAGNNTVAIPEPATTSLAIAGFLGLIIGVRRIRRRWYARAVVLGRVP